MTVCTNFAEAMLAIIQVYPTMRGQLPEARQTDFDTIVSSVIPPEKVSLFFELAYATRDSLDTATKTAAADVGNFAWINGFWGLAADDRGLLMEMTLRGATLPKGTTAPEPMANYVEAPAVPVDPMPAEPAPPPAA